jgi:ribonuclease-3
MVVCQYLFFTLPHLAEGELAKLKSYIISQETLNRWAVSIDLGEYLLVGKSEEVSGGRKKASILADAFEALIGAMFLDTNNVKTITEFILKLLEEDNVIRKIRPTTLDYKTNLQEKLQALFRRLPDYKNYKESGPDHNKYFEVDVYADDRLLGHGAGSSKKEAEMAAAQQALEKLK